MCLKHGRTFSNAKVIRVTPRTFLSFGGVLTSWLLHARIQKKKFKGGRGPTVIWVCLSLPEFVWCIFSVILYRECKTTLFNALYNWCFGSKQKFCLSVFKQLDVKAARLLATTSLFHFKRETFFFYCKRFNLKKILENS